MILDDLAVPHAMAACVDHGGRELYGMNRLRPLRRWGHGCKSRSRYLYLYVFILCLCSHECR
jgi:hypothetical protein